MAKNYDNEQDQCDDDEAADDGRPNWRTRLMTWSLALIALGLGFLIPYMIYLNQQVSQHFDQLRWQIPTRVYARPLHLLPGMAMDAATLKIELDAAGYRENDPLQGVGSYQHDGNQFNIYSRGYVDVDGQVLSQQITVNLSAKQLLSLTDSTTKKPLKSARLDPARIATLYGQKHEERRLVSLDEVPELLVTGLQAVEDRRFKSHHGVDPKGLLRALFVYVRSGGKVRQGASTLTQQLARSGLLGIGKEKTGGRKFNEMLFALILEMRYDKQTILETYLNQVYLGQRGSQAIHGVASASEFWFGRDLNNLNLEQTALLIALVKGPAEYNPRRKPVVALDRRNLVLDNMFVTGVIDEVQRDQAKAAPLGVLPQPGITAVNRYPAYIDLVRRQLANDYPEGSLQGAGLTVLTGMSPSAQMYAENSVVETLISLENKNRPTLESGLVLTDVHSGDVLAVVGSREVIQPGFNRALDAQRPVGSLLKPFVYLLALVQPQRYSLASWVEDTPVTVNIGRGQQWSPKNADNQSHGSVRLIDALAHSYNQGTVRVGMDVRVENLVQLMHALAGIKAEANPALILGATDQTPYGMTQLYQFLASGGEIQPLHAVRGVLDPDGNLLNRYDKTPAAAQSGDSIAANLVTIALQRAVSQGTGRRLQADGLGHLSVAGKTGTSNDSRDSWFVGYTGDHLAVVWVGNDANEQTSLYGSTGAMRVWSKIFKALPSAPLKVDDANIDWQWVQGNGSASTDASCPGAIRFPFVTGYAPAYQACILPSDAEIPSTEAGWRSWFGL